MDLVELQQHWHQFGKDDPLWAILTDPSKKNGRWDVKEFFQAGQHEIHRMLALAEQAVSRPIPRGRAMDFGCGVGRLTQALADHFERSDGVDIAPSMIDGARRLNQAGDRCTYYLNTDGNLSNFPDGIFDFIYTAHVLQHMRPQYARGYVAEFIRTLAPTGVLLFQIPTGRVVGATAALPDQAFRASTRFVSPPRMLTPGERAVVVVEVENLSPITWPSAGHDGWYHVTVGNHWMNLRGKRILIDDARASLPRDLAPGKSVRLELEVTAPRKPGRYILELDACQEAVAWFGDRGSRVAKAPIIVERSQNRVVHGKSSAQKSEKITARMEMYGTPQPEIEKWIREAGGELVRVFDWSAAMNQTQPSDWYRHGFIVTRASA